MTALISLSTAYLIGGFPTGVLISRYIFKKDVRTLGSGNPGAINVWRVFGIGYGLIVVSVDIGKGYIAAGVLPELFYNDAPPAFAFTHGILAVCGHIWSPFTFFRGGKGVGSAFGSAVALYPIAAFASIGLWMVIVLISRMASIASLSATICFPLTVFWIYDPTLFELLIALLLVLVLVYSHRSNLYRLIHGEELKVGRSN